MIPHQVDIITNDLILINLWMAPHRIDTIMNDLILINLTLKNDLCSQSTNERPCLSIKPPNGVNNDYISTHLLSCDTTQLLFDTYTNWYEQQLLLSAFQGHNWHCRTSSRCYTDFARATMTRDIFIPGPTRPGLSRSLKMTRRDKISTNYYNIPLEQ